MSEGAARPCRTPAGRLEALPSQHALLPTLMGQWVAPLPRGTAQDFPGHQPSCELPQLCKHTGAPAGAPRAVTCGPGSSRGAAQS